MKKITTIVLGLSLFVSSALMAHGNLPTHTGNHMHEGKMTNHSNPNGMTDIQMKKMNKAQKNGMKKMDMNNMNMNMDDMKSNNNNS